MTRDTRDGTGDGQIEEFAFLARSHHRVRLLMELSRAERSRRDLHEATGISQPTLGRILDDFETRGWISNNHNGAYNLTPLGVALADSVTAVLDVLETMDRLADLAALLPWDQLEFDPETLASARITTPTASDPLAHMRRFDELAADATAVRMFSNVVACAPTQDSSDADRELLGHVDELVVTADALEDLDDPALERWLHGRIDDGALALYRYEGTAAYLFGIFDGTVGIVPIDEDGMPAGLIESEAAPVRSWADDAFTELARQETEVSPASVET